MDSASFSICAQFLSDCRSAREANSTGFPVAGVKRLCGMVQYMAKFLPDLANEMEPIRELTRKEVSWNWSNEREQAFQNVKKKLTEASIQHGQCFFLYLRPVSFGLS
jgi:hypothetical protein